MTDRFLRKVGLVLRYLVLSVASFVSAFPFLWMIIGATNTSKDVLRNKLSFGGALLENLQTLFSQNVGFVDGLKNSLIVAIVTTVVSILLCATAGYSFEIYKSKKRDGLFAILLLTMMIPFSAIMIPLYRVFAFFGTQPALKWMSLNTYWSIIMPFLATAFLIFFFRQNTKSFSKAIIEAARIDGLGEISIFFTIYTPIMKSTFSAAAIIAFMNSWNNYIWPLLAVQSPQMRTVPMVLSALGASYTTDYGALMLGIVLATLPTAIIYFVMQKEFVDGMTGSVK